MNHHNQLLYVPVFVVTLLTATAFASTPNAKTIAGVLFAVSWITQFLGHGLAEKRAPAFLKNLLGGVYTLQLQNIQVAHPYFLAPAFILAPFFVHFELLFKLGYRPQLYHEIQSGLYMEIGDDERGAHADT